ncbi:hypothetical protein [Emticicia sp. C21]|uniref:hypothetical protein n=1 Tax=Emticicia sp. C21 TaxID=2302915 RepID=UPI000E35661C|nr:hypothetical protein [Emticicia sp. C21]RFS14648.1 hypothetical protein D0T08_20670 [Emticicia sp. C21]
MVRFIFDSFGNSHQDTFLKIDVGIGTNAPWIADFYFIPDFLEFESTIEDEIEWKKECFKAYLEHLINLVNLNLDKTYLVFDLSDEYVSAIKLEKFIKSKSTLYRVSIVYSHKHYGWGMSYKIQQPEFIDSDWKQSDNQSWDISKNGLLKGIEWSIENLG